MKNYALRALLLGLLACGLVAAPALAQKGMTKGEYLEYLERTGQVAPRKAGPAATTAAGKTGGAADVKLSVLDIGNVVARIRNTGTLGYDRDGLAYEFPFNSGITYRWTLGPMIAGRLTVQGPSGPEQRKFVSGAAYGAVRTSSEDEFRPLGGFDAGIWDPVQNVGIAFSDKPASWPSSWPTVDEMIARNGGYSLSPAARDAFAANPNFDPNFTATATVGPRGFPGVAGGEIRAPREAYFVITDNDPVEGGTPAPMNVRVDVWALQWDDFVNRNFIIYKLLFTNIGDQTIEDVYVGIHDDPDAPEQGSNEWTDDFAYLIPPGKDEDGDGVPDPGADPRADINNDGVYTEDDILLWNTLYLWDGDDKSEGVIPKGVGWVGLKFLETPVSEEEGQQLGVTALDIFQYSAAPSTDTDAYDQMSGALHVNLPANDPQQGGSTPILRPDHPNGSPDDVFGIENSYGPDVTVVASSGPYTLRPGESLPFTFASVHGTSRADLLNNAKLTQILFNAEYKAASGPPVPNVTAIPGDGFVALYWDDAAERGIYPDGTVGDPLTGNNAFEGYKIFRSDDGGRTWGTEIVDLYGSVQGFIPLATYDLQNGIAGESETRRFFDLGSDSGLRHRFVDTNVQNGKEYLYAVVAYDHQDEVVPPLETPINVANPDAPGDNTVRVQPMAKPAGITVGTADKTAAKIAGNSDIQTQPVDVVDQTALVSGTYQISFSYDDEGALVYTVTRGGEVVTDLNDRPVEAVPLYDPATDNAPIFDGLRVLVENVAYGVKDAQQTQGSGLELEEYYIGSDFGEGSPANLTADYELRFVGEAVPYADYYEGTTVTAPFEVHNLSTGERITAEVIDGDGNGQWNSGEYIVVVDSPFQGTGSWEGDYPADYALYLRFSEASTYAPGDVYQVITNKALTENDIFEFAVTGQELDEELLAEEIDKITVVPNPYVVSSAYEEGRFQVQRELQFHQLPERCSIRIFTTSGELVQVLEHEGGSIEPWNLQTYNGQEVAFGIYLYYVETPEGVQETGKFAIIK